MKLRYLFLTLIFAVVVLLSLAAGSLYWILAQSPLSLLQGGVTNNPTGAILIPRQAPVMVSLLVNPDRLEAFSQLVASPGKRKRSRREIQEVERSLLAKTGLNYQKEIQPWLGEEITLAVTSLDLDRNQKNGTQPGYLLAVNTKDSELAKEFLQVAYSQQAIAGTTDLIFEEYKGVNLIAQKPLDPTKTSVLLNASAVVGDFVLFANDIKVLRTAINNVQIPDLNLNNTSYYQNAVKTNLEPRIGQVYVNIPAFSAWIAHESVPETPEVTQIVNIAFSLKSEGLMAQTALIGVNNPENRLPSLTQPVGALNYVPANSIVTAASVNLNQFWQTVETDLDANSPLQQLVKQLINRLQQPLGLNLPKDIFNWVQGEYSLALVPNSEGDAPDWVFVAEQVPGAEGENAIANLDELAQQQGYSVGSLPLLDTTITAWTKLTTAKGEKKGSLARLEAQVRGVHTLVDKYAIFATSVEAMAQALSAEEMSLAQTEKFKQAISALPTDNDGYFYVDWNQSEAIITKKLPIIRVIELAGKPLFKNLRSLTLSSQGSEQGIQRATIFFNLGVK
jgi:hypothetical protein